MMGSTVPGRRDMLIGAGVLALSLAPVRALAQASVRPSSPAEAGAAFGPPGTAMRDAIDAFAAGARLQPAPIRLDVPELVDNGNSVPMEVTLEAAPGGPGIASLALFTQKNPQPHVAVFHFPQQPSRVRVGTRIRLADSQRIGALARYADGSVGFVATDVVVALAACLE